MSDLIRFYFYLLIPLSLSYIYDFYSLDLISLSSFSRSSFLALIYSVYDFEIISSLGMVYSFLLIALLVICRFMAWLPG